MSARILFVPDARPWMGGGHVMRSLTLARALEANGAVCALVATSYGRTIVETFGAPGGGVLPAAGDDSEDLLSVTENAAADILVFDHYGLSAEHEAAARKGRRVVVIDDLADRPHDADLLIDSGFGRTAEDYARLAPGATIFTGPAYAPLRPEFARLRKSARRDPRAEVKRALIALGMSGGPMVARALGVLGEAATALPLDIALGPGEVIPAGVGAGQAQVHLGTTRMAELMAAADIAMGAGGSSTWERACLGLPTLTLILADNQEGVARALEHAGAAICADVRQGRDVSGELPEKWLRLIRDADLRASLSERSSALCDGLGADRSARAILDLI